MKRPDLGLHTIVLSDDRKRGRIPFRHSPTLTDGAMLWQMRNRASEAATSRTLRPLRRPCPTGGSRLAKFTHSVLCALGIW